MRSADPDLTATARIRAAAIEVFAEQGMGAPVRAIAAAAGVSPALILHHFGSRAGLRAACDEAVLATVREAREGVTGLAGPGAMLAELARVEEFAPLAAYVLRLVQAGGPAAAAFVEHSVDDAETWFRAAVADGVARPSADERARARVITEFGIGAMLLALPADGEHLDAAGLGRWLREYTAARIEPLLELYTHGIFTDDRYLAAFAGQATVDTVDGAPPRN